MHGTRSPRLPGWLRPVHVFVALLLILGVIVGTLLLRPQPARPAELLTAATEGLTVAVPPGDGAGEMMPLLVDAASAAKDDAVSSRLLEAEGQATDDALIVRTASLELEVQDVAAVLLEARADVAALGGYVAGSDEHDQAEQRWARVVYRVPVARFSEAIDALRGHSERVVREATQSQEVTATIVDLDARISNLEASEAALVEIMQRSGRIDDVLAVQARLEAVRGQIEQLEAQRKHLADQAALSTITVSWYTPIAAVAVAQESWDAASQVDAALAQTVAALQAAASLAIWVAVVALPLLGIPLLLLGLLFLATRRRFRGGGPGGPTAATVAPAE